MKKIIYILALLVSIALSNEARANMPIMSIKVISVSSKDNEHVIQIEPQAEVNIPKKTIIHLQFNPSNADEKKQFDLALEALNAAAVDKNPITVGVMSNKALILSKAVKVITAAERFNSSIGRCLRTPPSSVFTTRIDTKKPQNRLSFNIEVRQLGVGNRLRLVSCSQGVCGGRLLRIAARRS